MGASDRPAHPERKLKASFVKKTFAFKRPSGTSRGVLTEKHAWFLYLSEAGKPDVTGVGECSVIPGLTPEFDNAAAYEAKIHTLCEEISSGTYTTEALLASLQPYPSILFGLETALLDLENGGKALFYDTPFTRGETFIPINGLIWMGTEAFMQSQIEEKLLEGYSCIKMKIGAIDFDKELRILASLRKRYASGVLTLRVDANGAFSPAEAMEKLKRLADLEIHSIEQPLRAGQWEAMSALCAATPLPVALDEELICIHAADRKQALLDKIRPQYIILKPSLHGGISGTQEWIRLAEERQIPWWMTSALESNVGLNAIAQLTATYNPAIPQGLGTGSLYVENTPTKMRVEGGFLKY